MLGRRPTVSASRLVAGLLASMLALLVASPTAASVRPVEDYASYAPQTRCAPAAKPGTTVLGHWLVNTYGGGFGPISRSCAGSSVSEHKEGRAFDWTLDAARAVDRERAQTFLARALATDSAGNAHALARRMGIMYIIWNDHMYASYRQFEPRDYLSSSCHTRETCSKTLRHRDHMHISLSRAGGNGLTSWYDGRLPAGS